MLLSNFEIELLSDKHLTTSFDSSDLDINEFLIKDALNYQNALMANTYVFHLNNSVNAFFCILNDCLHDKGFKIMSGIDFIENNKFHVINEQNNILLLKLVGWVFQKNFKELDWLMN